MPGSIPVSNFNTHPELDDTTFFKITFRIYYGRPTYAPTPSDITWFQNGLAAAGGSRYTWFATNLLPFPGNSNDGWFYNLPPWTWVVVIPVTVIVAGVLLWNAFGKDLYRKSGLGSGYGDRL